MMSGRGLHELGDAASTGTEVGNIPEGLAAKKG
jgi:hypothetical protein